MHMHPFHLCNVRRREPLSKRAVLKLSQRAGADLDGLFLLAMADSLASRGDKKPPRMEAELVELFGQVLRIIEEDIRPVAAGPPLLTGDDLITELGLTPGPLFRTILRELEALRVEGRITARKEALAWVAAFVANGGGDGAEQP
jgi:poly(A) polymerase